MAEENLYTLKRIEKPRFIIKKLSEIRIISAISSGSFGDTYLGIIDGKEVVLKNYKNLREGFVPKDLIKEVTYAGLFSQFPETNSVKLIGIAFDERYNILMILEKEHMDLFDYLRIKKEFKGLENKKKLFYKLIKSYCSLHKLGFIHSDIKVENIMFSRSFDIRLIDFGISKFLSLKPTKFILERLAGTESTRAPDATNIETYYPPNRVSYSSDVYSLGKVFLQVIYGQNVEMKIVKPRILIERDNIEITEIVRDAIGDEGLDLIFDMTELKATNRISLEDCLLHPFFTGIDETMRFDREITGEYKEILVNETLKKRVVDYSMEDYEGKNYELKYLEEIGNNYRYLMVPRVNINAKIECLNICLLYLDRVLRLDRLENNKYNSFDVILNTILNYKVYNGLFSVEELPTQIRAIGDPHSVNVRMLPDIMILSYINSQIFNLSYQSRREFEEAVFGDFDTETRSKQIFINVFSKEIYPFWLHLVYIETKLKFEIRDPRLEGLIGEILVRASIVVLLMVLSMDDINGEYTIWELVKFSYMRVIQRFIGIELDYMIENPLVDWLNMEKEKYQSLDDYFLRSLGFIKNHPGNLYPIAMNLFADLE